jgi:chromosome partitioning protein
VTRLVAVANQKGGVGKTTSVVNLAAALAQMGRSVLVIDLDPQGNASTALGVDHRSGVTGAYELLIGSAELPDAVVPCPDVPGVSVVPATIDLAGAEIELVSVVAREYRLQKTLKSLAAAHAPDVVLIDCPPSLGLLTLNALVAADEVLIPIQCEYYALEGLGQLLTTVELVREHLNPDVEVTAILLTMSDARTRLSAQVAEEVRGHFGQAVLETSIPRAVRLSEAPSHGQTVLTYDPSSPAAEAYRAAAAEFDARRHSIDLTTNSVDKAATSVDKSAESTQVIHSESQEANA